jgi:hypothetical protein
MRRGYQTQWAGQFGVAHELVRRGYLVTFTTGNARDDDLLCLSPSGEAFSVQVKSLSSKTFFPCQVNLLEPNPTRFLVFVVVPPDCSEPPEYFVITNEQFIGLDKEQKQYVRELEEKLGKRRDNRWPGIKYAIIAGHKFKNAWDSLPK